MEPTHYHTLENWLNNHVLNGKLVSPLKLDSPIYQSLTALSGLVTSIIRFAAFFQRNSFTDGTWAAVDLIIWTQVEPGVYLISACLMTFRPLLERIGRNNLLRFQSTTAAKVFHSNDTERCSVNIPLKPRAGDDNDGFHRLQNDARLDSQIKVTTNIHVGSRATKDKPGAVALSPN